MVGAVIYEKNHTVKKKKENKERNKTKQGMRSMRCKWQVHFISAKNKGTLEVKYTYVAKFLEYRWKL